MTGRPEAHASELSGSLKLYRRLLRYAWPYKLVFLAALLGMIVMSGTGAAFAALMRPLVDQGLVDKDPEMIRLVPPLIVAIFFVRIFANFLAEYSIHWVGRRVTYDLRQSLFAHIVRLPAQFYDVTPTGGLISRLIFNIEQISRSVTDAVLVVVRDGLTVIALLAYMFYLDWRLTVLFLVLAPVTALLMRAMSRRFRKTSHQIQASIADISQVMRQSAEGHRVVKAFAGEAAEINAFGRANEQNRRHAMRKVAVSAIGIGVLQLTAVVALAIVIQFAMLSSDITAGVFVSYVTAATLIMNPAKQLTKINEVIQTGLAAAQSAFLLLDEPTESDTGTVRLERVQGRIEYRHVGFRYPTAAVPALHDISFTVEPGRTLALVGLSGSGKTTVAALLPRFYRVTSGEILIDDVNINDLALADLRSHIALVGQETLLFDDTIRNNIAYGGEGPIDEARLGAAARAAHVLEFASQLPEGLDSRVGERGARLSGGQRQRVAIARALYKDAPILILDEATSALDTESEGYVQEAMQKLRENRTTLVIAHRLSTVERADRILVLAKGRIVESGSHAELLAREGVYANLYRRQFAEA